MNASNVEEKDTGLMNAVITVVDQIPAKTKTMTQSLAESTFNLLIYVGTWEKVGALNVDEEDIESVNVVIDPQVLILLKEEAEEDLDQVDQIALTVEEEREIVLREREEAHIRPRISTLIEADLRDREIQEVKTVEEAEIESQRA